MAYIKFKDKDTPIKAFVYPVLSQNRVKINTTEKPDTSGFSLFIDEEMSRPMDRGEYEGFTTLYRQGDGWYELSNDGSVYEEPVPTITFKSYSGVSTLVGEAVQSAKRWEDVVVPEVEMIDGWIFEGWNAEIPTEGEITRDYTFTAKAKWIKVRFGLGSEGGYLDGETEQLVNDYSELVIPTPVALADYKFAGWSPKIPSEGAIDYDNLEFLACFESTISERLAAVEQTLTDIDAAIGGE